MAVRRVLGAAAVAVLLAGCGGSALFLEADASGTPSPSASPPPLAADADAVAAEDRLGSCAYSGNADFFPPTEILGRVDRWVEVTGVPGLGHGPVGEAQLVEFTISGRDVGAPDSAPSTQTVLLTVDLIEGLDWAVRAGARAYMAMNSAAERANRTRYPEFVGYALVRHPDGAHFFLGHCMDVALTDPARKGLGDRYDAVMARIVGKSGKQVVKLVGRL